MTDFVLLVGFAVLLSAFAFWNRREIRRGRDLEQVFVARDIKIGWLRSVLGNLDYFSKVTMPLAVAALMMIIGTYRLLDRG